MGRTVQKVKSVRKPVRARHLILDDRRTKLARTIAILVTDLETKRAALLKCEADIATNEEANARKARKEAMTQLAQDLGPGENPADFINPYDED